MDNKGHILDELFKEKLSDMEIPLEEDYWPLIEKGLTTPTPSFYKFGWKHLNIYNVSTALLLLLLAALFFFNNTPEEKVQEPTPIQNDNKIHLPQTDTLPVNDVKENNNQKTSKEKSNYKDLPLNSATVTEPVKKDSVIIAPKEVIVEPVLTPEPVKVTPEVKPKPKKIIYVVEQDTIVEKDTVKVRRKRKK